MLAVKTSRACVSVSSEYQSDVPSAEAASQKEAFSKAATEWMLWVAKSKDSNKDPEELYSLKRRIPFFVTAQLAHVEG